MRSSTPIGVQLYTLRDDCTRDLESTLRAVAAAGYSSIEFFGGFFGLTPARLREILDQTGLSMMAAHVPLERLEEDLDRTMDAYEAVGCRTLVCPWLSEERRQGDGAFESVGRLLCGIGERLRANGFELLYHNHDFELTTVPDPDGLHRIIAQCDPGVLALELDVYWLAFAGVEPAAYIREMGSRVRLVHLKDGRLKEPRFAPLGQGEVDLPSVLEAGEEVGVKGYVVEQDLCDQPPLESIKVSLDYLRSLGMRG
jgi:sugar phosphate isomerase/epimerase